MMPNHRKRHPITHPLGRDFFVYSNPVLYSASVVLKWCMRNLVILGRVMTAPDCIFNQFRGGNTYIYTHIWYPIDSIQNGSTDTIKAVYEYMSICPIGLFICAPSLLRFYLTCVRRWWIEFMFPHHRLQREPLVSDPGMHHGTCVTHVPWWMSASLTRGGGEKVPVIPGACATRNFTYLARDPCRSEYTVQ